MPQPTLTTDRITLVPYAEEHRDLDARMNADPEVMRYLFGRAATPEEAAASHARRLAAGRKIDGLGFWAGEVDGELVGWWCLQPAHGADQPDDPGVADLGYRLLRAHWRQGLASEGARELVRYGFEETDLVRIIARTMSHNIGSQRTMRSAGLSYVRTYPSSTAYPIEGATDGEVEYDLTRERWTR